MPWSHIDTYNILDPIDMDAQQYWQVSPTHYYMEMDKIIRCWHIGESGLTLNMLQTHNTFRARQNCRQHCILFQILLKIIPDGPIYNKSALIRVIMAWPQISIKPLFDPMLMKIYDVISGNLDIGN